MKKNIYLFLLLLTCLLFSLKSYSQVPALVEKTFLGALKPSDFENQESYFINIDTTSSKDFLSGEITRFKTKEGLIYKINNTLNLFEGKKIDSYKVFENNMVYYPRKYHYSAFIGEYKIDWWFSKTGSDKLETITLVK